MISSIKDLAKLKKKSHLHLRRNTIIENKRKNKYNIIYRGINNHFKRSIKQMKSILHYITLLFMTILFFIYAYGCIGRINHNKDFINMILTYYPEYEVKIIDSDPNQILINIKKEK